MPKELQLTDEILGKLVAIAKASGIDLGIAADGAEIGDLKPVIPAVNLNRAVSEIAHETGLNLKDSGLYLYADNLVTVDDEGKAVAMTVKRFRAWVDGYQVNFYKRRAASKDEDDSRPGPPIKATLKKDVAEVILASDDFLCHIPIIRRILPVRLPVWDKPDDDGKRHTKLLPYGYDPETKIFTQNTGVEYLEMWTLEQAVTYLRDLLKDFPYGDEGRSMAVQVAAMLTMYCQLLFADRDRWPMIFFNANQPGSGKSRLAEMCIYPIYGTADPLTYSDNDEFLKKLDTCAKNGKAYAFLDDVSGLVKNNDLNRWITSPTWAGRNMHSQVEFSMLNQKLTLLTGNQATLSEDLTRRMLMVDLWSSELAGERQGRLGKVIDQEWLAETKHRGDMLSALFALVRNFSEAGSPVYHKLVPSFEGWSRIVPSIVTLAGFDCPLATPNVQDAGGKQEVEFLRLLEAAVRDYEPQWEKPADILLADWCRLARYAGVFHGVISDTATMRETMDGNPRLYKYVKNAMGMDESPNDEQKQVQASRYMDKAQSTKFGGILNKFYRGQIRKVYGKRYKFADRQARHSTFTLELLDRPGGEDPQDEIAAAVEDEAAGALDVVEPVDVEPEGPPFLRDPEEDDQGDDERCPF